MSINAATPSGAPAQNIADSSGSVQETLSSGTNGVTGAQGLNSTDSTAGGADEDYDPDALSLDELVGSQWDEHPELKGGHKGLPDYKKILEHLPENGRKLLGNLRSSYTQKTQEISDLRKALEAERSQLARDRELLSNSDVPSRGDRVR